MLDAPDVARAGDEQTPRRLLAWALSARRRARAFAPDVVHAHLSTPAFGACAALVAGGAPSVYSFHLLPEEGWPLDRMLRVPSAWTFRWLAKTGRARFVAVSRGDAASLRARFSAAPVRTIANVPPPPEPEANPVTRSTWGSAGRALLFVGRLAAQKGLSRLLRALASPALAGASFRLLVLGEGPDREDLERLTLELDLRDRVTFAGERPSRSAMEHADLVLCPSHYEGMPLVPMESVLAGSCVVASSTAAHEELFADVPESLLPQREADWPLMLARLLSNPEVSQSLAARQATLRPRFSFDRLLADYRTTYENAIDSARPRTSAAGPREHLERAR
jgi:glycosyltransferase involved in cell wall biosynthesis